MKIMIAGSQVDTQGEDDFKNVCHSLCQAFKGTNYEFIIGSERKETADYYFFNFLRENNYKNKIKIFYHDNKEAPFKKLLNNPMPIEYEKLEGTWEDGRVAQIIYSDIILIIGGSVKTEQIVSLAKYLKKPIIPIPHIRGGIKKSLG